MGRQRSTRIALHAVRGQSSARRAPSLIKMQACFALPALQRKRMPPKILVSCPSAEVAAIAREMAPKGFETVVSHTAAEVAPNLSGIEYMITYPHISMGDPFYKA